MNYHLGSHTIDIFRFQRIINGLPKVNGGVFDSPPVSDHPDETLPPSELDIGTKHKAGVVNPKEPTAVRMRCRRGCWRTSDTFLLALIQVAIEHAYVTRSTQLCDASEV